MREPNSPEPSDHDDVPDLVDDEPTAAAVTSADEDAQETRNETDKTQRPQSFRTTFLHALRAGFVLGALCLWIASSFFMGPFPTLLPEWRKLIPEGWPWKVAAQLEQLFWWLFIPAVLMLAAGLSSLYAVIAGRIARFVRDLLTMICVAVTLTSAGMLVWNWWRIYQTYGVNADQSLYIAAALTAVLCFVISCCLLIDSPEEEPGYDPRPLLARMSRFATRITLGQGPIPQRHWGVAVTALLLPALMVPGLALIPPALLAQPPVTQQLATPVSDDALPAMPATVGTAAAWSREFKPHPLDIAAGARGPIILTKDGLEALNPEDGTTLWSYHRDHTTYLNISEPQKGNKALSEPYLVTSPDRKHIAFIIAASGNWTLTIILDTMTGHVTAERLCDLKCSLQLTDSAALVGDTAISLTDGSILWSFPPHENEDYNADKKPERHNTGFTGTAGHSTFIREARYNRYAVNFELVPDTDPTQVTTLENVNPCAEHNEFADECYRWLLIDGWAGVIADGSPADKFQGSREVEAVSIDEIAAKRTSEGVKRIPLGQARGINYIASMSSGQLVTYPPSAEYDRGRGPWVGSILDTTTGTVHSAAQSTSLAGAEVGYRTNLNEAGEAEGAIVLKPGDGSPEASIPLPWASVGSGSFEERVSGLHYQSTLTSSFRFLATPGAVIVAINPKPFSDDYYHYSTHVYGVR